MPPDDGKAMHVCYEMTELEDSGDRNFAEDVVVGCIPNGSIQRDLVPVFLTEMEGKGSESDEQQGHNDAVTLPENPSAALISPAGHSSCRTSSPGHSFSNIRPLSPRPLPRKKIESKRGMGNEGEGLIPIFKLSMLQKHQRRREEQMQEDRERQEYIGRREKDKTT